MRMLVPTGLLLVPTGLPPSPVPSKTRWVYLTALKQKPVGSN